MDIIGAETGGERDAEGSRVSSGQMMDQWERFDGGKVGVKDVERGIGDRWSGVMQGGDRMRDGAG
jgi:hypothetical protein